MSAPISAKEDLIQEQILTAAKHLFQVYGLAKVTMDDVAKAIGKGRSSLYYYYKNKDEIFDAVFNVEMHEMLTAMEMAANQAKTVEEKINAFFITKLKVVKEKGAFFSAIRAGMDAEALTAFQKTKIVHHNTIMKMEGALLTRILNEGIKRGELKAIKENEMDILIFILLSSIRGIRNEINLVDNATEFEPTIAQFTGLMMNGLKK
ncbi:TetR/AcrR family transcriptional regulator [Mucilaginibacter jinjuensis]|uniref:TetR/AcrR family transcriptional regulator n=1 Tax=Mucilaginibacter jinjuensis TaxID=1176721 RepID=A0ABY7TEM7_9SPHI|nr:TetR/AcrR family transcriptional regulator [Mucilaginibacter jinjuensis]WCT14496.1 TetR/AcrR family transcriptional regulator [Mucilaginibacter jinjuensis]